MDTRKTYWHTERLRTPICYREYATAAIIRSDECSITSRLVTGDDEAIRKEEDDSCLMGSLRCRP